MPSPDAEVERIHQKNIIHEVLLEQTLCQDAMCQNQNLPCLSNE